jgi:hypothetical protein
MDFALAPPWADLNHPFQIVEEGKREITEHRFYAEIVTAITKRNSERKDT